MSEDKKYNGWTNYETWRVRLEMFDSRVEKGQYDPYRLGLALREEAEEQIEQEASGMALGFAMAFLQEVNWTQIASHCIRDGQFIAEEV